MRKINEYLTGLALRAKSASRSSFKHAVYGLRYYFRLMGLNKRVISLPSLKKEAKLPVILNRSELKELFKAPTLLKHRIVLTLIYSAGLRAQEVINLKLSDIDFERRTIHIRQSKYKKDRIVPLAHNMSIGLKKYLQAEHPHLWLFNGKEPDGRYSVRGLSWVMRESLKKALIGKEVTLHSLRHSYATHLLEEGLNIVTVKELLGHAHIATTMIYLHVAQCPLIKAHSPLDTLIRTKEMNLPQFEIADVIRQFGAQFARECEPNSYQQRVLNALSVCRTSALGGHKEVCDCCGKQTHQL